MTRVARNPLTPNRTTITPFSSPIAIAARIAAGTPMTGERLPETPAATIQLSAVVAMIEKSAAPAARANVVPTARMPNQDDDSRMLSDRSTTTGTARS